MYPFIFCNPQNQSFYHRKLSDGLGMIMHDLRMVSPYWLYSLPHFSRCFDHKCAPRGFAPWFSSGLQWGWSTFISYWLFLKMIPFFRCWRPPLVCTSFKYDREDPCKDIRHVCYHPWMQLPLLICTSVPSPHPATHPTSNICDYFFHCQDNGLAF